MSSSVRPGRVIRSAPGDDLFVLGQSTRARIPTEGTLATAASVIDAAEREAERAAASIIAGAEERAAAIIAEANASASSVRDAAHAEGFATGQAEATGETQACVQLIQRAANEGKAVRDQIAEQASAVVARAVSLALRRLTGEYYEAAPERTAAACAEALRAAAGQQVLSIRVNPAASTAVQAALSDAASYVRPDGAVAIGGCIIDLRNGTIDATLDARLALMELALREAGGEVLP